jgi:hypothetical protein
MSADHQQEKSESAGKYREGQRKPLNAEAKAGAAESG